jgi:hypothetical protein
LGAALDAFLSVLDRTSLADLLLPNAALSHQLGLEPET